MTSSSDPDPASTPQTPTTTPSQAAGDTAPVAEPTPRGPRPNPTSHPILTHLDKLLTELRGNVPLALREFDEEAIHQSRVATRRLAAALNLLEPLIEGDDSRDLKKVLKKLRRRLGPHRDLDVLIGHIDDLSMQETFTTAGAFVSQVLRTRREALRRRAREEGRVHRTLMRLDAYESVREELVRHLNGVPSLVAEGVHTNLEEFAVLADLLSQQSLVRSHENPPTRTDPGHGTGAEPLANPAGIDPHELRISGKLLRYSLELADVTGVPGVSPLLKTFKQLQDALGLWHDYVVLAETALDVVKEHGLTHRQASTGQGVLIIGSEALRLAGQHLGVFTAMWADRGAKLTGAIRQALPLTRPGQVAAPHPDEWPVRPAEKSPEKPGVSRRG